MKVKIKEGFQKAVRDCLKTTTKNNINQSYEGVLFYDTNMMTTDIHRITRIIDIIEFIEKPFLINNFTAKAITKMKDITDFSVNLAEMSVKIEHAKGLFSGKLLKNDMPEMKTIDNIFPDDDAFDDAIDLNLSKDFKKSFKFFVQTMKREKTKIIPALLCNNKIIAETENKREIIEIDFKTDGKCGFNLKYLDDALNVFKDGCQVLLIKCFNNYLPVLRKDNKTVVILPLRTDIKEV